MNLKVLGWGTRAEQSAEFFYVVSLFTFLALQAQLVVLVSAFVMGSTVWSVSCLLFFYSRCPPCPAICISGGSCAPWSRRHRRHTERYVEHVITTIVVLLCVDMARLDHDDNLWSEIKRFNTWHFCADFFHSCDWTIHLSRILQMTLNTVRLA